MMVTLHLVLKPTLVGEGGKLWSSNHCNTRSISTSTTTITRTILLIIIIFILIIFCYLIVLVIVIVIVILVITVLCVIPVEQDRAWMFVFFHRVVLHIAKVAAFFDDCCWCSHQNTV